MATARAARPSASMCRHRSTGCSARPPRGARRGTTPCPRGNRGLLVAPPIAAPLTIAAHPTARPPLSVRHGTTTTCLPGHSLRWQPREQVRAKARAKAWARARARVRARVATSAPAPRQAGRIGRPRPPGPLPARRRRVPLARRTAARLGRLGPPPDCPPRQRTWASAVPFRRASSKARPPPRPLPPLPTASTASTASTPPRPSATCARSCRRRWWARCVARR
mmetsp:Transcript_80024/g.193843  ORF Transcript_80024/g.193843 Transcript_80024/m.193843 type:complete len:223 (-) Transcript_80024:1495-2163(-)